MSLNPRKIVATLLICAPFCVPQPGHASLNTDYPTDADGNVEVPALSALSSAIVGTPMHALCAPPDGEDYGWTWNTTTYSDDGTEVTTWEDAIYISGPECAELARLTRYDANKRFFKKPKIQPIPKPHTDVIVWPGDNDHIYNAGAALLALVHESLHVKLASTDEGVVECAAIRNVWPSLAALSLPMWLNKQLLVVMRDVHLSMTKPYRTTC